MDDDPEFIDKAGREAVARAEEKLIKASRKFEDASRVGDEYEAARALEKLSKRKANYDRLTGQNQGQPGRLSVAQQNFLSRRAAGGDELTPTRMKDYALAHTRAVNAGIEIDSPQYFAAVERSVDHQGDGRIPPLDEREAARISGVDEQTYAHHAARLRALKASGHYQD